MSKGSGGTRGSRPSNISSIDSTTKNFIDLYNNPDADENQFYDALKEFANKWKPYNEEYRKIEDEYESKYWKKNDLGYSSAQKDVMQEYANNSYLLNSGLENGILTAKQAEKVKILDSCFRPAEKDIVVYKGWIAGELRNSKGYCSTSVLPNFASNFSSRSGGLGAFLIPKGTPILRISMREDEILLPRNFNIKKHRVV